MKEEQIEETAAGCQPPTAGQFGTLAARMTRMTHPEALALALTLKECFLVCCARVVVAGSIRRMKPEGIKDIELVVVPEITPEGLNLFGESTGKVNLQLQMVEEMKASGIFRDRLGSDGKAACGERFQRLLFYPERLPSPSGGGVGGGGSRGIPNGPIAVDIFCVLPPAQWGVKLLLATGPADFNHRLVTVREEGGKILPPGYRFEHGQLIQRTSPPGEIYLEDQIIDTPEEEDVFRALGLTYIPPEDRK
jgi:DNA polymerase/3'-5' exonuclease PolX